MKLFLLARNQFWEFLILAILGFILLLGCKKNPNQGIKHPVVSIKRYPHDNMVGKKMDALIAEFGLPDGIYPRSNFQVIWQGPDATVALNYLKYNERVFVSSDCTIVCVSPIIK